MLVYVNSYGNRLINNIQISFFCSVMTNYTIIIIS